MLLRVDAGRQGCLVESLLAADIALLPASLAAIDVLLDDLGVYAPIYALWVARDAKLGNRCADRRAPDDRDGDVCAVDGAQGAHGLGV